MILGRRDKKFAWLENNFVSKFVNNDISDDVDDDP